MVVPYFGKAFGVRILVRFYRSGRSHLSGKSNRKYRAAFWDICHGQRAAVFTDDSMRQGQADAVTLRLGGEERNEDFLQVGCGNPIARVLNRDCRPMCAPLVFDRSANGDSAIGLFIWNCFGGVAEEIEKGLAQHAQVSLDFKVG